MNLYQKRWRATQNNDDGDSRCNPGRFNGRRECAAKPSVP
jgi:hypothetical protein